MQLAYMPRKPRCLSDRLVIAACAGPSDAGHSRMVSRFLPTGEKSNYRIILQRITSAKTPRPSLRSVRGRRATAKQRQLHIPPGRWV
jgi:hypothetical protein